MESKETQIIFNNVCRYGIHELVKYFLDKNIQINKVINRTLLRATVSRYKEVIELIANNEKCIEFIDKSNKCLMEACSSKHININIIKYLTQCVDVNKYDATALLYACVNNNLMAVVHLCECINGIDFEKYGNKALRLSAKYGHIDVVKYLIEKGADPNVISNKYYDKDVNAYLNEIGVYIKFEKIERGDDVDSYNNNGYYNDNSYYSDDDMVRHEDGVDCYDSEDELEEDEVNIVGIAQTGQLTPGNGEMF